MTGTDGQFKDHFSGHAADYAAYRPTYPNALFKWLAGVSPGQSLAWDCATGNGQVALELTDHFDAVIASDASSEQIVQAQVHPRICYRVEQAENSAHTNESLDLLTVGQAYHWFDHDRFVVEAGRVLKPGGVVAIWTYKLARIEPGIDEIVFELYEDVLGNYWPPERRFVERNYVDFELPWPELSVPSFEMEARWNYAHLIGYLNTWSALRRYVQRHNANPLETLASRLERAWGDQDEVRKVTWPLIVRAWRKPA